MINLVKKQGEPGYISKSLVDPAHKMFTCERCRSGETDCLNHSGNISVESFLKTAREIFQSAYQVGHTKFITTFHSNKVTPELLNKMFKHLG